MLYCPPKARLIVAFIKGISPHLYPIDTCETVSLFPSNCLTALLPYPSVSPAAADCSRLFLASSYYTRLAYLLPENSLHSFYSFRGGHDFPIPLNRFKVQCARHSLNCHQWRNCMAKLNRSGLRSVGPSSGPFLRKEVLSSGFLPSFN